ncbi:MAG: PD-(D/E)XK nuclease family protein [Anaerolineae bacterium]
MNDLPTGLPEGFLFSQHSLTTYQRCKRRFWYRYVQRQPWPMAEDKEPLQYQQQLARGVTFHRWLERAHLGMPVTEQVEASNDPELQAWWRAWLTFDESGLPRDVRQAELPLVVPFGRHRLYARYDLLTLDRSGRAVIIDWKTLRSVPSLAVLRNRLQTRIYCCLLVTAGAVLAGIQQLDPEQITMCYWFANDPQATVYLPYSRSLYEADLRLLHALVAEIDILPEQGFTLTEQQAQCARCNYRTLCERAADASSAAQGIDWLDEEVDFNLDMDQTPVVDW